MSNKKQHEFIKLAKALNPLNPSPNRRAERTRAAYIRKRLESWDLSGRDINALPRFYILDQILMNALIDFNINPRVYIYKVIIEPIEQGKDTRTLRKLRKKKHEKMFNQFKASSEKFKRLVALQEETNLKISEGLICRICLKSLGDPDIDHSKCK